MAPRYEKASYDLFGIVQGVGFRPALARMASASGLAGRVQNMSDRVRLELAGPSKAISRFVDELPGNLPPNARLDRIAETGRADIPASEVGDEFEIIESDPLRSARVVIPADLRICSDCEKEILDPANRRYGYPFTTCTACGPRYTVVNAMPYDRERTTLASFPLCPECQAEYDDPADRRYHAESIACPQCGPRVWLEDKNGPLQTAQPLAAARQALSDGLILSVRGIGGYLLAADPFNADAVRKLRERKQRPDKPFALMARDPHILLQYVELDQESLRLLAAPVAPILIVKLKGGLDILRGRINPDIDTLGVMLPTSPLHKLLFEPLDNDPVPPFELLIMTSGNRGGEPICISNPEARERLDGIHDLMLAHNREINLRNDDSLFAFRAGAPQIWRRARGCAPDSITVDPPLRRSVLAMGAGLRNTIAIGDGDRVTPSPHIGDLDTPEAAAALERVCRELPDFLKIEPEQIAVDLHPDLESSRLGRRLASARGLPLLEVQHHHAHAAACLGEHGLRSGLALVMDGTGLGTDGLIWGAELLAVDPKGYTRVASFSPAPLPGGDAATLRPSRQIAARLIAAGIEPDAQLLDRIEVSPAEFDAWRRQIETGVNTPYTTAAGRLFDSCSALLGISPARISYDAQAAIRLEAAARHCRLDSLPRLPFAKYEQDGMLVIDWQPTIAELSRQKLAEEEKPEWALAFHYAIADAALAMIEYGVVRTPYRRVALSGGVMMNRILNDLLIERIEAAGLEPLIHRRIPPNDGGIAFGQALIAGGAV